MALWNLWSLITLFDLAWFISGQTMVFRSPVCRERDPELFWLAVTQIILFYITIIIPIIFYILALWIARRYRTRAQQRAANAPGAYLRGGLSKNELASLRTFLFKPRVVADSDGGGGDDHGDAGAARGVEEEIEMKGGQSGGKMLADAGEKSKDCGEAVESFPIAVADDCGATDGHSAAAAGSGSHAIEIAINTGNSRDFEILKETAAVVMSNDSAPFRGGDVEIDGIGDDNCDDVDRESRPESVDLTRAKSLSLSSTDNLRLDGALPNSVAGNDEGDRAFTAGQDKWQCSMQRLDLEDSEDLEKGVLEPSRPQIVPVQSPLPTITVAVISEDEKGGGCLDGVNSSYTYNVGSGDSGSGVSLISDSAPGSSSQTQANLHSTVHQPTSLLRTLSAPENSSSSFSSSLSSASAASSSHVMVNSYGNEGLPEEQLPEGASTTCAICFNDFEPGERIRELACHHLFHADCVDPWLAIPEIVKEAMASTTITKDAMNIRKKNDVSAGDTDADDVTDTNGPSSSANTGLSLPVQSNQSQQHTPPSLLLSAASTSATTSDYTAHRTCPLCVREAVLPEFRDPEVEKAMAAARHDDAVLRRVLEQSRREANFDSSESTSDSNGRVRGDRRGGRRRREGVGSRLFVRGRIRTTERGNEVGRGDTGQGEGGVGGDTTQGASEVVQNIEGRGRRWFSRSRSPRMSTIVTTGHVGTPILPLAVDSGATTPSASS